jgi:hypothetical protein
LFVFLMNAFAALAAAIHFRRRAPAVAVGSLLAGVGVLALFFGSFAVGQPDGPTGLFQRITIVVGFTWLAAFAYRMWTTSDEETRSTAQPR